MLNTTHKASIKSKRMLAVIITNFGLMNRQRL